MAYNADGTPSPKLAESPPGADDYVLLKNVEAFPRAWVVHDAELQPPIWGLKREDRQRTMERLLYRGYDGGFQIWKDGVEYPLRSRVLIETADAVARVGTHRTAQRAEALEVASAVGLDTRGAACR